MNRLIHEDAQQRVSTREMAYVFLKDIDRIRKIVNNPDFDPDDVRYMSVSLRRLLTDTGGRDLSKISSCRIGKMQFNCPNVQPLIVNNRKKPWQFLSVGGALIYGSTFPTMSFTNLSRFESDWDGYDPEQRICLTLDSFMKQPVVWFKGKQITREDFVKYVSHCMSVAHSSSTAKNVEVIQIVRHCFSVNRDKSGKMNVSVDPVTSLIFDRKPFNIEYGKLDLALIQLLSTARVVVDSNDTVKLEQVVGEELNSPAR